MSLYWRPILSADPSRPREALQLAGGWLWFDRMEVLERGRAARVVPASEAPGALIKRLVAPRPAMAGLALDTPRIMAILNTTPDSFSDGGKFNAPDAAIARARALASVSDILDIGGESTRPGAPEVPVPEETARTAPVIAALRDAGIVTPISIDTRKAAVAQAALSAGADIVNDVSAMEFDPAMAGLVSNSGAPVCLMHMRGTPETMKDDTAYADVLLDIHDALEAALERAVAAGIAHERIILDPGIGFAKTVEQNLALVQRLGLLHGLGCPLLLGVSRKRFIGSIGGATVAADRMPGSIAVALAGVAQGAQILRVHDAAETRQALRLWQAVHG